MDNRHDGERNAAQQMVAALSGKHSKTIGVDKGYDTKSLVRLSDCFEARFSMGQRIFGDERKRRSLLRQKKPTLGRLSEMVSLTTLLKVLTCILIASLLFISMEEFIRSPGRDSSAFLYVGKGILQGDVPYVDRWDHKGPLLYFFNVIGLIISGSAGIWWGLWTVEIVIFLATVYFAYKMLADAFDFNPLVTMLIIIYFFYLSHRFELHGNFTEFYGIFFQFLSIYFFHFSESMDKNQSTGKSQFIIGVLGCCAFLLRPNLIGLWLAIGVYWLSREEIKRIVLAALGGILTLSIFAIAFISVSGLTESWDAIFAYNFAYANSDLLDKIKAVNIVATKMLGIPMSVLIAMSWFLGLFSCFRKRQQRFSNVVEIAVIAAPFEILFISFAGSQYQYPHYILPLWPIMTILTTYFIYAFSEKLSWINLRHRYPSVQHPTSKLILLIFCLLLTINICVIMNPSQLQAKLQLKYNNFFSDAWIQAAKYIKENSSEDDKILVWGAQSEIYLYSNRDAPTRFFYQYPLVTNNYTSHALIDEFTSDVVKDKPIFIVDTHSYRLPPLDKDARIQWNPPQGRYIDQSNNFEPFLKFIDRHYKLVVEINDVKSVYQYDHH